MAAVRISLRFPVAAFLRDRGPDIHADGIWLPQNLRTMAYCLASCKLRQVQLTTKNKRITKEA